MSGKKKSANQCGFAAAQCGKALPYRWVSKITGGYASQLRRSLKRKRASGGKAEPFRTVLRQSRKTLVRCPDRLNDSLYNTPLLSNPISFWSRFFETRSRSELESKVAIESAVLAGPLPGITSITTFVERLCGIADFAIFERHEWRIPNKLRHLAAEVVGHCLDID
jgi:hypothetical protein